MTKDEIIKAQSRLIVKLIQIGTEQMQEVADLFSAIELEREGIKGAVLRHENIKKRRGRPKKGK